MASLFKGETMGKTLLKKERQDLRSKPLYRSQDLPLFMNAVRKSIITQKKGFENSLCDIFRKVKVRIWECFG